MAPMLLEQTYTWRVIGKSVRGAGHVRSRRPNQDAIAWWPRSGEGAPLALAVADGHGSPHHFRSHVGAKQAVRVATALLHQLWQEQGDNSNLSAIKHMAEERLPQALVQGWRRRVLAHLDQHPVGEDEWQALAARAGPDARTRIDENPLVTYGTTLLAGLIDRRFILYVQLGDGDILTVAEDGAVSRPPLPGDERLLADQTTSLCSANAWLDFRLHFQPLVSRPPALILLSTDGYANSFADEAGFRSVGSDLLRAVRSDGLHRVSRQLGTWLRATSAAGSGDDITLGLIYRMDSTPSPSASTGGSRTAPTPSAP